MSFEIHGLEQLDAAEQWLEEVQQRMRDLGPLGESVREILVEDNRAARVAGVDVNGAPLVPLRDQRPAAMRRRGGDGPPLAPRREGSRVVTAFEVQVLREGDGSIRVRGSWPSFAVIVAYHAVGAGRLPVRNIVSDDQTPSRVIDAANTWAAGVVTPSGPVVGAMPPRRSR